MRRHKVWKGMAAGIAGGLAAAWVMNQFQAAISKTEKKSQGERQQKDGQEPEPANVQAAEAVSKAVLKRPLPPEKKKVGGELAHYVTGAVSGGMYGALSEVLPMSSAGAGTLFGAAVWLVADEIAVPALKLSKPPTEYPVKTHVQAFASHIVYGVTTELIRRGLTNGWSRKGYAKLTRAFR